MSVTAKQRVAAIALAQGRTQLQASVSAGVNIRSVERWCLQPEFKAVVAALQKESYDGAVAKLVTCSSGAVVVLATIAADVTIAPQQELQLLKLLLMEPIKATPKHS